MQCLARFLILSVIGAYSTKESQAVLPPTPHHHRIIDPTDLRVSRVYWDVHVDPIDPMALQYDDGDVTDYALTNEIGHGAFSEVFLGYRHSDNLPVVVKHIKDSKEKTINREIQILQALKGIPYVLQLVDAIREGNQATLVFPYKDSTTLMDDVRKSKSFTLQQIKRYFYELFYALNQVHQRGIMHRDIKGQNIIITGQDILLIDWGLSAFYTPMKAQPNKMGTRYYKAPELLMGYNYYDYSIDIWAVGCMLADYTFKTHPLIAGKDNDDQLRLLIMMLGYTDLKAYLIKYDIYVDFDIEDYKEYERYDFNRLVKDKNEDMAIPEAIDLLNQIFIYDHQARPTAAQIITHPYFRDAML